MVVEGSKLAEEALGDDSRRAAYVQTVTLTA